jgi:hypothetical protein
MDIARALCLLLPLLLLWIHMVWWPPLLLLHLLRVPILLPELPLQAPLLLVVLLPLSATILVPGLLHLLLVRCTSLLRLPLLWMLLLLLRVLG